MANGSERGRGLAAALTALAVIGLVVVVAIAIKSYDTESDVVAAHQPAASGQESQPPAPAASPPPAVAPLGGVATGGGGAASDHSGSVALPIFAGVAVLTLLTAAGVTWRQRLA